MVKSLVSKLSAASSNLSIASTISSVVSHGTGAGSSQDSSSTKNRNDPGRFFGDGVQFKAKLIGILEVGEARGDRMCQEALQDLKMAIRAAGEHKQRITIHVTIDGLRLRDEKTGDSLYHHPVHKISFIAQDMTDSRAFGYIFGSPDSGHRFFGIKTDKAASQVVLAMRDLFQVVFELKKKEIELARQQIQSKSIHDHQSLTSLASLKATTMGATGHNDLSGGAGPSSLSMLSSLNSNATGSNIKMTYNIGDAKNNSNNVKEASLMSPESVADLVDLEQELSSIQRGITQMERITPSDSTPTLGCSNNKASGNNEDPFGDSFTNFPTYNLLPPPESTRSRSKSNKTSDSSVIATTSMANNTTTNISTVTTLISTAPIASNSPMNIQQEDDDSWLKELDQQNDVFDTSKTGLMGLGVGMTTSPLAPSESTATPTKQLASGTHFDIPTTSVGLAAIKSAAATLTSTYNSETVTTGANTQAEQGQSSMSTANAVKSDAFTDLDPLGTGRIRPYVDKKYFFQELKNPPKKVLKDLSGISATSNNSTSLDLSNTIEGLLQKMDIFEEATTTGPGVDNILTTTAISTATSTVKTSSAFDPSYQQLQTLQHSQILPCTSSSSTSHQALTNTLTGIIGSSAQELISIPVSNTAKLTTTCANFTNTSLFSNTSTTTSTITTKPTKLQFPSTVTSVTLPTNFNLNNYNLESGPVGTEGDATIGTGDPVMLPRDTDPFSPTRKKSDPFQEGDIFANLDPFEFEFCASNEVAETSSHRQTLQQRSTPVLEGISRKTSSTDVFNGPLQVSLPPENGISTSAQQQWKPLNESMGNSVARSRPSGVLAPGQLQSNASSAFKQQTADVISSISNKKMPHLFGQARFSKRDSNSINMRRLQESDSLSENESAPEPPPRPDSVSYAEPPPLPPKKQFSDIVIRPRVIAASSAAATISTASVTATAVSSASANRYEALNSGLKLPTCAVGSSNDVPPIPLPSRRVGRSDGMYPGPGRPRKPGHTEDDYLAPISSASAVSASNASGSSSLPPIDVPPLLPPPTQISNRARTQRQLSLQQGISQEIYENKSEILREKLQRNEDPVELAPSILPDITLSQLLTLGIDELATKLNVPTSKLSTMTLVELTSYLSEFIEKSKPQQKQLHPTSLINKEVEDAKQCELDEPVIFKVNFDQEATFVAKFDDNFGEVTNDAFVANFEQFNVQAPPQASPKGSANAANTAPAVPPADRYAVFREIIDQEKQQRQEDTDLLGDMLTNENTEAEPENLAEGSAVELTQVQDINSSFVAHFSDSRDLISKPLQRQAAAKIDTKITEVVAQAKDRYAALRDIILVENLFENPPTSVGEQQLEEQQQQINLMSVEAEFSEFGEEDQYLKQIMENDRASSRGFPAEVSSSALTVGDDDDEEDDNAAESSLDSNDKDSALASRGVKELAHDQYEKLSTSTPQLDCKDEKSERSSSLIAAKQDSKFLTVAGSSGLSSSKDDLEIDELMQRAISNLSLDSRERSSPATAPVTVTLTSDSSTRPKESSPAFAMTKSQFNDVSTSPIPLQKSAATIQQQLQQQQKSHLQRKSPEASYIPAQLSAVSHLIDTASRQISADQGSSSVHSKESWATFDSPKTQNYMASTTEKHRTHKRDRRSKSPKAITLHIPPPPPSNASQNDTAESPCSSDPRDERWNKNVRRWPKSDRGGGGSNAPQTSSSSRDLSPWDDEVPENYPKPRRGHAIQAGGVGSGDHPHGHADRHGYCMRHVRRMNSCDEDYDYDDVFSKRRDHRKFKQGISRSRDHFEFESSNWYHHPQHHTWSPQDEESSIGTSSRARSFDRSTYERNTYGPPLYDKRGIALPAVATHDRRSAGIGYDKRKYYRDYSRPMYDFDGYGEPSPQERRTRRDYENIYDVDTRSPMGIVYNSKTRAAEYIYERDRKSFDRESIESFDSATRRRRSFGSGDVYGSLQSREEFRERYIGVGSLDPKETTRSLRKGGLKSRNPPTEIDYDQDSDINDFQQQRGVGMIRSAPLESRNLQRPNQLVGVGSLGGSAGGIQQRARKSSGSSPWDGDEPLPHISAGSSISANPSAGQKLWKRPSSAAESERRLADSARRAPLVPQTLSGSDGEKDRRFRKKQRLRGKESTSALNTSRYGGHPRENYDYMTYANDNDEEEDIDDDVCVDEEEYDDPPTDEDKFERLNRRRQEMHQRMLESEHRRHQQQQQQHSLAKGPPLAPTTSALKMKGSKYHGSIHPTELVDFDDFETSTPVSRSGADSGVGGSDTVKSSSMTTATNAGTSTTSATTKFTFEDGGGFESDFNQNSPPPAPAGTASSCNSTPAATISAASTTTPATKSSFRFSNDFSEREKHQQHLFSVQNSTSISSLQQFDLDNITTTSPASHATPPITQKLRFDDNVKISKFDNDSHISGPDDAFEDDFAKAEFDFEKEDQWSADALQNATPTARKNNMRSSKLQQRQELIKKSESINIFAKKSEDPFEDDDFFNAPTSSGANNGGNGGNGSKVEPKMKLNTDNGASESFQWEDNENNFAKFDDNM